MVRTWNQPSLRSLNKRPRIPLAPGSLRDKFLLRPDVTFLNHGSFGACPAEVFAVYQDWQRELEAQPVEFVGRRFPELMRRARGDLAAYLNADEDDLVFVPNATTAINTVARSLPLRKGDEILATDLEYGALDRAWTVVCADRGARYVRRSVSLPLVSEEQFIDEIWSGVTPRTRVLYLSHITSTTALTLPIAELLKRARARGIITVIDGAHAPGQIALDLSALGADFYTGNCHKWMMTPKGCAFLYARRDAQSLIRPLVVSWGDKSGEAPSFVQELEFQGTNDFAAYLSVSAAIAFMADNNWQEVRVRCHRLVNLYRTGIRELTGLPSLSPDDERWYSQMSAHPLPSCDGDALQRALFDKFRIEIPVTEAAKQYLRISIQGYNTVDDVSYLLETLTDLLPQFLHPDVA